MTSKEKHPEISRPVIRKGRRRRSSIGKVHLAEVNLPSIHDLIAEAKTYQRGWFTKSYDDVEGQAIEKKIMIVKNVAPTLKKFVKGMNNFKNSASEAENYNREFIQEMKQSMYQVTGFPEFGDSVPAAGKAFSIVHQGFRVNEMNVGKFVNKISTTTQKFNSFADRAIEELEKICGARSDFAQNYLDKKSKYVYLSLCLFFFLPLPPTQSMPIITQTDTQKHWQKPRKKERNEDGLALRKRFL